MHEQAQSDSLCIELQEIWLSIAQPSYSSKTPELSLGAVYVTSGILTALKLGLIVAKPRKEKE